MAMLPVPQIATADVVGVFRIQIERLESRDETYFADRIRSVVRSIEGSDGKLSIEIDVFRNKDGTALRSLLTKLQSALRSLGLDG